MQGASLLSLSADSRLSGVALSLGEMQAEQYFLNIRLV